MQVEDTELHESSNLFKLTLVSINGLAGCVLLAIDLLANANADIARLAESPLQGPA